MSKKSKKRKRREMEYTVEDKRLSRELRIGYFKWYAGCFIFCVIAIAVHSLLKPLFLATSDEIEMLYIIIVTTIAFIWGILIPIWAF